MTPLIIHFHLPATYHHQVAKQASTQVASSCKGASIKESEDHQWAECLQPSEEHLPTGIQTSKWGSSQLIQEFNTMITELYYVPPRLFNIAFILIEKLSMPKDTGRENVP